MLAHASHYGVERQFEILLFLYSRVLPRLGSLYSPETPNWTSRFASLLTSDGSPIEYSWKWNGVAATSTPDLRYCIESIGSRTGSPDDPFNYGATEKLLADELAPRMPQLDLTWFRHFSDAFGLSALRPAPGNPDAPPSSTFVAFEHVPNGVVVKAYFVPPMDPETGGPPNFATFANAARSVLSSGSALDSVLKYVGRDAVGATLLPDMLAIDCIDQAKSRVKLYASSEKTSFASILSVMTLGGKIQTISQESIDDLEQLFRLVLGLEKGFSRTEDLSVQNPFDANLAHPFDLYGRMTYYFDIAPNAVLPVVKLYIPVVRYGKSDEAVTEGLGKYLRLRGRGEYHAGFASALEDMHGAHPKGSEHRLQTWISAAFEVDGTLSITSYINPGIYHSALKK